MRMMQGYVGPRLLGLGIYGCTYKKYGVRSIKQHHAPP